MYWNNRRNHRSPFYFLFVVVCILAILAPQPVFADNDSSTETFQSISSYNACIAGVPQIATDQTKFPDMQLNMRFVDSQNNPITSLLSSDLQIQENSSASVYTKSITAGQKSGADFYFVIDSGNHANPLIVKKVLEAFHGIMIDGNDNVTVISNQDNSYKYLGQNITSKDQFYQIIQALPDTKNPDFYYSFEAVNRALMDADKHSNSCSRPLFLVMVSGDWAFDGPEKRGYIYTDEISKTHAKVLFIHTGDVTNYSYKNFSENTGGQYIDIPSIDQTSELIRLINGLESFRQTYVVNYRSNNGGNGNHQLSIIYQGQKVNVIGTNSYSIQLETPLFVLSTKDNSVLRLAKRKTEEGYIFDKENQYIDITVDWKGYPRGISSAKLIVNGGNPIDVKVEKISDSEFRFVWDMTSFDQRGSFPVKLELQIVDELNEGISERTYTAETSVNVINRVPVSLMTTWLLYGLYGLFALMVVAFLIWRKKITASIIKGGKSVGEAIRKTIVGNRNSRKTPIAALEMIDGPSNLIGKELPIYSESVNLGRDPAKSDMIFFGPDSLTSVSGLHCKIQCLQGGWQITALSSSRSETFIDDESMPFLSPVSLRDGQKIRMGYYAQQPVEFIFHIKETAASSMNDPRKTNTMGAESVLLKKQSFVPDPNSMLNALSTTPPPLNTGSIPPPLFPQKPDSGNNEDDPFKDFR